MTDLLTARNLGPTSSEWLRAVGISTLEDLRRVGSIEAFSRVAAHGFNASAVLLYALEGALTNTHWHELSPDTKAHLRRAASEIKRRFRRS